MLLPSGPSPLPLFRSMLFPRETLRASQYIQFLSSPVHPSHHYVETFSKTNPNLYSTVFQVCLHIVASLSVLAENQASRYGIQGIIWPQKQLFKRISTMLQRSVCASWMLTTMWTKPSFPARVVLHISFLQCSSWILQLTNSYSSHHQSAAWITLHYLC